MIPANMLDAKTNLSKYVAAVANRKEPFVVLLRNGVPVAKIVPYQEDPGSRIGIAKGKIPALCSLEDFNSIDVSSDFLGDEELL